MRERKSFNQGYRGNLFVGRTTMILLGVGLVFMFGLLYLSQNNRLAAKTDSLHELETKRVELLRERERLQIEATRLQSIQEIQKTSDNKTSSFVPTNKINYLPPTNVALGN